MRTRAPFRVQWRFLDGVLFFDPMTAVYGAQRPAARCLNRRTGASSGVPSGRRRARIFVRHFAYLLSLRHGSVRWRQLLPGRVPARPVTAADGALFTPLSTDSAIVLSLKDGKPVNRLQIGQENSSSAAPVVVQEIVFLTTAKGLMAFSSALAINLLLSL